MYSSFNSNNDVIFEVNDNNEFSDPMFPNSTDNYEVNDCNDIFTQTSNKEDSEDEEDTSETNSLSQALNYVEKLVVSEILATLTKRYSGNQYIKKLLQKASFLDPRHRNKDLGDQNQICILHNEIKLEMEQINDSASVNPSKNNQQYTGKI